MFFRDERNDEWRNDKWRNDKLTYCHFHFFVSFCHFFCSLFFVAVDPSFQPNDKRDKVVIRHLIINSTTPPSQCQTSEAVTVSNSQKNCSVPSSSVKANLQKQTMAFSVHKESLTIEAFDCCYTGRLLEWPRFTTLVCELTDTTMHCSR